MKEILRSIRSLLRQRRYTLIAIGTLAAGIGVNSAMFGLLDAVFFRPLPLVDPDRLVNVTLVTPASRFPFLSYEEFRDIERSIPAFKDSMAIGQRGVTFNRDGETSLLLIHYVSGRYFPSLGIPMHLGRGFTAEDDRAEATHPQVVINHHLWKERLGAPFDIIGRTIDLNSTPFTVIGVTAPGFVGLERIVRTDVWVTTAQAPLVVPAFRDELSNPRNRWFEVTARLADGADVRRAQQELDALAARWRQEDSPEYRDRRLIVQSRREASRRDMTQGAIFLALVSLVLLIACANVANLTLARCEGRRRELSVRAALGATRGSLLAQLTLESAIVSAAGAAGGVMAAAYLMRIFPALLPPGVSSIMLDLRVDARLLVFSSVLAAVSTALVGLVPAWRGSRVDIASGLKSQSATTTGGGRGLQLRDLVVVGEIAVSGTIVICCMLLVRSFAHSLSLEPGFDTSKSVASFYLGPGLKGYDSAGTYRLLEECRREAALVPGVVRASYGIRLPAQANEAGWSASLAIPGVQPPPGQDAFAIRYTMVGPDYFQVIGTRILRGRGFNEQDRPDSEPVAVISETMARRFWPGENPVGRRLQMGKAKPVDRRVVGVAEDVRISGLFEPPEIYVYVPYAQDAQAFGLLLVETSGDVASIVAPVRAAVARIAPAVPILAVSSVGEHVDLLLYEDRRNAWIALAVALLALTLGGLGVHGVVSLVTVRRTKEIGIRIVLGARRGELLRMLLARSVRFALAGAALGIAGGLVAGRLLASQLHGIEATDLWSFVMGTIVCVLVPLTAGLAPGWRAARLDPAVALRDQ